MPAAIDEECGRAINAATDSAGKIGAHPGLVFLLFQSHAQFSGGELQFLCELQIKFTTKAVLIFEEQVVHFPEFIMRAGKLG